MYQSMHAGPQTQERFSLLSHKRGILEYLNVTSFWEYEVKGPGKFF
jgi:hypothetical protein